MGDVSPWPWNVRRDQRRWAYMICALVLMGYVGFCLYILVQAIDGVRFPLSTISYHASEQVKVPDIRVCYDGNDVVFADIEIFASFHPGAVTWPWDNKYQQFSTRPQAGLYLLNATFQVSNVSNIQITQSNETFYGFEIGGGDYLKTTCWDFASSRFVGNSSMYIDILFRFRSYDVTNFSQPLAPSFVWTTVYHGAEVSTPYDMDYRATQFDIPPQTFTQMVLAVVYKNKLWNRDEVWYRTTNLQTFAFSPEQTADKNLLQIGYTFDQEGVIYLAEINTLQYTTLLSQWAGVWIIVASLLLLAFVAVKDRNEEEDPSDELHIRFTKSHRETLSRSMTKVKENLRLSAVVKRAVSAKEDSGDPPASGEL